MDLEKKKAQQRRYSQRWYARLKADAPRYQAYQEHQRRYQEGWRGEKKLRVVRRVWRDGSLWERKWVQVLDRPLPRGEE